MAVGRLFTNTSYLTVSGTTLQSDVGVDRWLGEYRVVSMECVAVGWLVWVMLLVGVVAGWSVGGGFVIGW